MDPNEFLLSLRSDLKKQLADDLEKTLEALFPLLLDSSKLKNELVHLEGTFNQIESETRKGIIDYDFRLLQLNRIRESAMQLIDEIGLADLDAKTHPELHTLVVREETSLQPEPVKKIQLPDFEIFVAENESILKQFPRIYRSARSLIVRGQRESEEMQEVYETIRAHLPALKAYAELLRPIEAIRQKLRMQAENKTHYLRFQQLAEVAAYLELSELNTITATMPQLKALHQQLSSLGILAY